MIGRNQVHVIAFSSFKPFNKSTEVARNQLTAKQSWEQVFDQIVYFNDPEAKLASAKTVFVPWEPFPKICDIADFASQQAEWSCIINADIVVPISFKAIELKLQSRGALAATSWRYEFDPARGIQSAQRINGDNGLDFFAAVQSVWYHIADVVPGALRLGCDRWDCWMLGALNVLAGRGFYSLTKQRVIFHPKHGDRHYGYDIPQVPMFGACYWPPEL